MSPQQPSRVDPKIWQCCVGSSVKIPKLHSRVYYFPQGYLEHAFHSPNTDQCRPFFLCVVSGVDLFADHQTDEVFAKLILTPITNRCVHKPPEVQEEFREADGDKAVSFSKTLTKSDANNGGAFSVPCECAKLIFPPLDLKSELPSQELVVTDIHGEVWNFRHTYRGNPKRHLITINWSKFVDTKKLIAGDSLVLMKNSDGKIYVGIRRHKSGVAAKITEKSVMEAGKLADKNMAFEVVYYPTAKGWCDFVVDAKAVEDAMKIKWNIGMRVKLCLKTDESSKRCSIIQGTISALSAPFHHPWRMLQVNWDEPGVSQNPSRVSPWQVELISNNIPTLPLQFPSTKKFKTAQDSSLSAVEGPCNIPVIEFDFLPTPSFNRTSSNCDGCVDGMQGDRPNLFSASTSSNFLNDKGNGSVENHSMTRIDNVPAKLNIISPPILNSFEKNIDGTHKCNTEKVTSFKLFGYTINVVETDLHGSTINGEDGCKRCKEDGCKGCKEDGSK